jgi:hypothetical protein
MSRRSATSLFWLYRRTRRDIRTRLRVEMQGIGPAMLIQGIEAVDGGSRARHMDIVARTDFKRRKELTPCVSEQTLYAKAVEPCRTCREEVSWSWLRHLCTSGLLGEPGDPCRATLAVLP